MRVDIPDLSLEDYEVPTDKDMAVEDRAGGSLTFAVIGTGQGGGRIAKAFYDYGYKKCIAINTSPQDLAHLTLPKPRKILMDIGEYGAGKDMSAGYDACIRYKQTIFDKMRAVFGSNVDQVLICVGAGGGSGGGSSLPLIDIAKKYMAYIGHDNSSKRVGVIMSLPTRGESGSPTVADNAYNVLNAIGSYAEQTKISPLLILDNAKIERLYRGLTVAEFWPTINDTVAGLFHVFNKLSTNASPYASFDPADYATTLRCGGTMVLGIAKLTDLDDEISVSSSIRANIEKTLLADVDMHHAKVAACVAVGGHDIMQKTPGLMDSLNYGFDTLASLCPNATIHRGIYEDTKESLRLYTIVGGLKIPEKRAAQLKVNSPKGNIENL